jgi:hypothetical protein
LSTSQLFVAPARSVKKPCSGNVVVVKFDLTKFDA